ncbi:uncharacterized protein LOC117172920 isoform X2 [Belonocnema kinseyi]|uniref:uncharacterized protein LOC117172920 isoform X2 n=1 Tax=Belonocnema kinseyi TaxID=2817044 RepID=UPI00143CDBDA|nr:uncharacterized protein LOC117172920 isoform X2 [Belonocnema kinseyi]
MASLEGSPNSESENQNQFPNSNVKNSSLSMDQVQISEEENEIEMAETNILNSSNQEPDTSGDWYGDNKFNLTCIPNENEEAKTTWKRRNLYSMPNSKFQAYWKDRFPDSIIGELHSESSDLKTGEPNLLSNFRDFIATYQESNGTPPTEFSFISLIKVLAEAIGKSLLALIYIIVNMAPLIEMTIISQLPIYGSATKPNCCRRAWPAGVLCI